MGTSTNKQCNDHCTEFVSFVLLLPWDAYEQMLGARTAVKAARWEAAQTGLSNLFGEMLGALNGATNSITIESCRGYSSNVNCGGHHLSLACYLVALLQIMAEIPGKLYKELGRKYHLHCFFDNVAQCLWPRKM